MRYTRPMPVSTRGPEPVGSGRPGRRPRLLALALPAVLVAAWEGTKALFALPTYQLPHVHEILGEFLREGAGGTPWAWIMAHNAAYTALEGLAGFALGGAAGLALAVLFAGSRLLERGLLPYVMVSQTV